MASSGRLQHYVPIKIITSSSICFFPEFFALQSEIQNHGSKRGRLKSAKQYPYRSSRMNTTRAKCSDSRI